MFLLFFFLSRTGSSSIIVTLAGTHVHSLAKRVFGFSLWSTRHLDVLASPHLPPVFTIGPRSFCATTRWGRRPKPGVLDDSFVAIQVPQGFAMTLASLGLVCDALGLFVESFSMAS